MMEIDQQARIYEDIERVRDDAAIALELAAAMDEEERLNQVRSCSRSRERGDRSRSRERGHGAGTTAAAVVAAMDGMFQQENQARSRHRNRNRGRSGRGVRSSPPDPNVGVGKDCSICLEKMTRSERRCILVCNQEHVFHDRCIKTWLRSSRTCPVCRGVIRGATVVKP